MTQLKKWVVALVKVNSIDVGVEIIMKFGWIESSLSPWVVLLIIFLWSSIWVVCLDSGEKLSLDVIAIPLKPNFYNIFWLKGITVLVLTLDGLRWRLIVLSIVKRSVRFVMDYFFLAVGDHYSILFYMRF